MTGTFVYSNTFWDYDCVGRREPTPDETSVSSSGG
jgi:hypothetical protein